MTAIVIDPIVAVDSMTLVWGLRGDGPEEKCKRAKWLLRQFELRQTQVVLPSVVLAEYLTPFDTAAHADVIAALSERFLIKPFDLDAASLAADLYRVGQKLRTEGEAGGRAILRADSLIIATAKVYGATKLYSGDEKCRKLADHAIIGEDLPVPPTDLFGHYRDL